MPIQVARYSLAIPMIKDGTEHERVDTSIVTSSKPPEFSRAGCGYVIASNFFTSSESVKVFTMDHQVTPSVSSFSEYLELFLDFSHLSVSLSDVIPLAISDVRPPRKLIYLFVLSLGVTPSEYDALHLLVTHDEISKQIVIYNDDYKFAAYPHRNLQKFTVKKYSDGYDSLWEVPSRD